MFCRSKEEVFETPFMTLRDENYTKAKILQLYFYDLVNDGSEEKNEDQTIDQGDESEDDSNYAQARLLWADPIAYYDQKTTSQKRAAERYRWGDHSDEERRDDA